MDKSQTEPVTDDAPLVARASGDAPAERRCLTCGTRFQSEGWHNRLCRPCARRGEAPRA